MHCHESLLLRERGQACDGARVELFSVTVDRGRLNGIVLGREVCSATGDTLAVRVYAVVDDLDAPNPLKGTIMPGDVVLEVDGTDVRAFASLNDLHASVHASPAPGSGSRCMLTIHAQGPRGSGGMPLQHAWAPPVAMCDARMEV